MDIEFVRRGIRFVADHDKAQGNLRKHHVSFERAEEAFFDPFLKVLDASRHEEVRDAILGHPITHICILLIINMIISKRSLPPCGGGLGWGVTAAKMNGILSVLSRF